LDRDTDSQKHGFTETGKLDFYVVYFEYFEVGFTVSQSKFEIGLSSRHKWRKRNGGLRGCHCNHYATKNGNYLQGAGCSVKPVLWVSLFVRFLSDFCNF
jgi:hypothetical protein